MAAEWHTVNAMNEGISAIQSRIADLQRRFSLGPTAGPATTRPRDADLGAPPVDFASLLEGLKSQAAMTSPSGGGADVAAFGDMRSTEARRQFATDLLKRLGMPQTQENMRAMLAWQAAEGTAASFNPLATTRAAPGATDMNTVGVKNFRNYEQGLVATIDTLRNGLYGDILAALRDGTSAARVAQAVAESPWGTGDGVARVLESGGF